MPQDAAEKEGFVPFTPEYWETWHFLIPAASYGDYIGANAAMFAKISHFKVYSQGMLPKWDDRRPWFFVSLQAATDQAYFPLKDETGSVLLCGKLFRSSSLFVELSPQEFGDGKEGDLSIGADAGVDTWITFARRRKPKKAC